jgi:hypothetical protein
MTESSGQLVTLAIRDDEFERAKYCIGVIIRRRARVSSGGYACIHLDEIDDLAEEIIKWIGQKKISTFAAVIEK